MMLEAPGSGDAGASPWIPLGPAHLLFWVVLIWPVLSGLVFRPVLQSVGTGAAVFSWMLSGVFWALGGGAVVLGFKGEQTENPGALRRGAFLAALVIWLIQVAIGLVFRLHVLQSGDAWYTYLRLQPLVSPILASVPVLLLLLSREDQSGGTYDAAIAALAMLGGLGFLGPCLLAFGALIGGHPLLAAAWDALRRPAEALKGEWFDGGDDALAAHSLGQMALLFILGSPLMVLLMLVGHGFNRGGFDMTTQWIRPVAAWLSSLLLGLAALRASRRSGIRAGRGVAIAALVLFGLFILPAFLLGVVLVLFATHVIR